MTSPPSFAAALAVWTRIGLLSFGGPAGQIAMMHRILVDEKKWISDSRFLHALNYCMLLPGPEAQQLATYVGWLLHGTAGGLAAGVLFILPGMAAILGLSVVYALLGNVGLVGAMFFGLKAAVLAIVVQAVQRVGNKALKNQVMGAIALTAFIAIFVCAIPFPAIVLTAGVVGFVGGRLGLPAFGISLLHGGGQADMVGTLMDQPHTRPSWRRSLRTAGLWLGLWLTPVAALLVWVGPGHVLTEIGVFFSKMAVVTFGGAYAVLAYVGQEAVGHYHWLNQGEMLDGLGLAETTPGPLIMVLQFVGFMAAFRDPGTLPPLLAGTLGGLLATWVTFTPCFLWIFLGAPFIETLRGHAPLSAALAAITAAVVGVIANLALWFALHTLFADTQPFVGAAGLIRLDVPVPSSLNLPAAALALAALTAIFGLRLGMITTLALCAAMGVGLHLAGLRP